MEIDLSDISISGAKSIFMERLRERDERLFLKKDIPGYRSFSRSCPSQYRKQPISLTDSEKAYIDKRDKEHGISSYDEFVRYGSPGNEKYNYICPRFWCLRDDKGKSRSLTVDQINAGECGGWDALVPEKAKKVPKGKRIVQFTDERFHRENARNTKEGDPARKLIYKPMYPGFQDTKKHPDGLCVPCCFQNPTTDKGSNKPIRNMYKPNPIPTFDEDENGNIIFDSINGEQQIKPKKSNARREECHQSMEGEEEEDPETKQENKKTKTKRKSKKKQSIDDTPIMGFPLSENQLGYMNISLQKFLGFNNREICYSKKSKSGDNKRLKQQTYCILRFGITKNKKQSFLSLLGNVYNYYNGVSVLPEKQSKVLTIDELKSLFIENLTLDKFLTAQNGVLPQIFKSKKIPSDLSNYNNSKILKKMKNDPLKIKMISSYENFINYFNDDDEIIDHRYIWDLVCKPKKEGGVLFTKGINLLILKNPDDDITNKIELICPTSSYSNEFFSDEKKTLLVYLKNDYYEPLCKIRTKSGKVEIRKFFTNRDIVKDFQDKSNIKNVITNIKKFLNKECVEKKSYSKSNYDYERNLPLFKIEEILNKNNIIVNSQYVNYNNQVIGVLISLDQKLFYLPILPSAINIKKGIRYINEIPYNNYLETVGFLKKINELGIPCDVKRKLIDDNMIVGIITATNQIVPVIPIPKTDISDDIEEQITYIGENFIENNINTQLNNAIDEEREKTIKAIELENNFYNLFRNTFKIIVNFKENKIMKENILNTINNVALTYVEKINIVIEKIHIILDSQINFDSEFILDSIDDYKDLITCLGLKEDTCNDKSHCTFMRNINGECILSLPSKNLYNGNNNRDFYFKKLSDEIIRFNNIRKYLFTPRTFLSFDHVNYKINDDEIILLEEILLDSYLDNIVLKEHNKYIESTNVYNIKNPVKGVNYKNEYNYDEIITGQDKDSETKETENEVDILCSEYPNTIQYTDTEKKHLFKNMDLSNISLIQYKKNGYCVFKMIQFIIKDFLNKDVTVNSIKSTLINEYKKLRTPETILKPVKGQEARNWSLFSVVQWYSENKELAKTVFEKLDENKNNEIALRINEESYFPREFDIILLCLFYRLPVFIKMKGNQKIHFNTILKSLNILRNDDIRYVIIVKKILKEKNYIYSLLKHNKSYKLNVDLFNSSVKLDQEIDINMYIDISIKNLEKKYKKKLLSDGNSKKVKKLGRKKKLSSS